MDKFYDSRFRMKDEMRSLEHGTKGCSGSLKTFVNLNGQPQSVIDIAISENL